MHKERARLHPQGRTHLQRGCLQQSRNTVLLGKTSPATESSCQRYLLHRQAVLTFSQVGFIGHVVDTVKERKTTKGGRLWAWFTFGERKRGFSLYMHAPI